MLPIVVLYKHPEQQHALHFKFIYVLYDVTFQKYFWPMLSFYICWEHKKVFEFLVFLGGMKHQYWSQRERECAKLRAAVRLYALGVLHTFMLYVVLCFTCRLFLRVSCMSYVSLCITE